METTPSTKFGVEFFNHVTWVFGLCIAVWPYLWSVLTIDVIILSSQYDDKLFMAYAMMHSKNYYHLHLLWWRMRKSVVNWGWFMQWSRKEVISAKIIVISYQHLGITVVFERSNFGWQESAGETVHGFCTQYITQNLYKDCYVKIVTMGATSRRRSQLVGYNDKQWLRITK
jgi:hypothetical protein